MQRRKFVQTALLAAAGLNSISAAAKTASALPAGTGSLYMIGPLEGYSPQIGTIVSMLNYNRSTIIGATKDLSVEQLDHLQDAKIKQHRCID